MYAIRSYYGAWVIRKACQQNVEWQKQGLPKVRVAVNLSGQQLLQPNLVQIVAGIRNNFV